MCSPVLLDFEICVCILCSYVGDPLLLGVVVNTCMFVCYWIYELLLKLLYSVARVWSHHTVRMFVWMFVLHTLS